MTYNEFKAELKAGLPRSLYIFAGEEEYLKETAAAQAKEKLVPSGMEDFNYRSWRELPDFAECNGFVNTLPMTGGRKLLVLRRCGLFEKNVKQKADWEKLFSELPDYICVILWEGELKKGKKKTEPPMKKLCEKYGETVDFPFQTESLLVPWLARQAAAVGKLIDRACATYIIASLGRSMVVLKTEMQKISAYAAGEQITRADIDAVIIKPAEDRVYKLIDAITDGRRDLCFAYLYEMRQNRAEPAGFLALLSDNLIEIYRARLLLDEGLHTAAAAKAMGGGWKTEKSVRTASKTSDAALERLIGLCKDADRAIKQGKRDGWAALEIIVTEMKI